MGKDVSASTRRQALAGLSTLFLGTSLGLGARPLFAASQALRWGSASLGSSSYVVIEALASTVNRLSPLKGSSLATAGATENVVLMGRGEIDLGQTTSWEWGPARKGEPPFGHPIEPVQMLAYAAWSQPPLVRAESGLRQLSDLAGKRIGPGPIGGTVYQMWKILFEQAGMFDKVQWSHAGWRETHEAFKAGQLDCTGGFFLDGRPTALMRELELMVPVRPLHVDRDQFQRVQAMNPGFLIVTLDPEGWPTLTEPVEAPGLSGILGAVSSLTDDDGYTIVKTIFDNAEEIRKISVELGMLTLENATKYLLSGFPVNAGAERFYRERGVWPSHLTSRG